MAVRKRIGKRTETVDIASDKSSAKTLDTKSKLRQIVNKRNVLILLGVIIVAGVLYYLKGLFVVALVNGQPITRLQVIQELEKRGGQQTVSSLVTQALILQEAKKQGVNVTNTEIDEEVKKVEDSMEEQGQSLDDALVFQGLTRDDFEEQIRVQKLVEKMLAKDIQVSDKEVSDYIEQNKDNIPPDMEPEEVTSSARQQLKDQKLSSRVQEWLADLQSKANIQYFVNY